MDQTPRQYREWIHGFITIYDETARLGVRWLRDRLEFDEARVLFNAAREQGQAPFEDDLRNNYTLVYNKDNTYTLIFRHHE